MRPTDNRTRELIVSAKQRGEEGKVIANWLNVHLSTVNKVWKRFKDTNSVAPKPRVGGKSKTTPQMDEQIIETIREKPDITLRELIETLNLPLTIPGLHLKLKRLNFSYKKDHFPGKTK
jgi:transposase